MFYDLFQVQYMHLRKKDNFFFSIFLHTAKHQHHQLYILFHFISSCSFVYVLPFAIEEKMP